MVIYTASTVHRETIKAMIAGLAARREATGRAVYFIHVGTTESDPTAVPATASPSKCAFASISVLLNFSIDLVRRSEFLRWRFYLRRGQL